MSFITERTETVLSQALIGDQTSFYVPDDSGIFDEEQQALTVSMKALFGASAATKTFKIVDKDGERSIYSPSVVSKDGIISVEWGGEFFPVDPKAVSFDGYRQELSTLQDVPSFPLKVRVKLIKPEDAKTKVTKAYAALSKDDRGSFLNKAWANGTIVELLTEAYPTVTKLKEVPVGKYEVVEYKMGGFEKYLLRLDNGLWVRANSAIQDKLVSYEEMGIPVTSEEPALLTVGKSTRFTATGHPIIPVELVSFRNVNLPIFDFS